MVLLDMVGALHGFHTYLAFSLDIVVQGHCNKEIYDT